MRKRFPAALLYLATRGEALAELPVSLRPGPVPLETEVQLYHLTSRRGFPAAYGDNIQTGPQEAPFCGACIRLGGGGKGEGESHEAKEEPSQCVFRVENFVLFLPELQYNRCTLEASYFPMRKRLNPSNHPTHWHSIHKTQNPYSTRTGRQPVPE